ncbi:hypothetical protein KOI35_25905 [Actinoplanes bogorensis]|uniref:Uncharacterized protein n=1 Tax=Paractinoplanes bogorensis TaxID=1610840 RepID=A0ABS5YU51_9ACTN|nr:hypothetical protein [Actinoplanes bogorensis]MBU2666950.1 hypothetical protein [Actinoplanes bogorensis]
MDLVRLHVRKLLEAPFLADQARRRRAHEIVRTGRPVVQDVRTSATGWELRDWLTGAVLARGDDGPAGLSVALTGTYHADCLYAEVPGPEPGTPGVPSSLGRAVEEWLFAATTSDEDVAEFAGWPLAKVREHR